MYLTASLRKEVDPITQFVSVEGQSFLEFPARSNQSHVIMGGGGGWGRGIGERRCIVEIVPKDTKIMSNVSCFKRLNCLFLLMTVEVTLQLRLKNVQYADQLMAPPLWGSY